MVRDDVHHEVHAAVVEGGGESAEVVGCAVVGVEGVSMVVQQVSLLSEVADVDALCSHPVELAFSCKLGQNSHILLPVAMI